SIRKAMNLMDMLMEEAPSAPVQTPPSFEYWVSPRTDGKPGVGTQSDPFNCSTIAYPAVPVVSLTYAAMGTLPYYEATVVTAVSHGFKELDMVTMSGIKLVSPEATGDLWYAGTFQIYEVTTPTTFKYTMLAR